MLVKLPIAGTFFRNFWTRQHWIRQAVDLAALVCGSRQLIQNIIIGYPRIYIHDGESFAQNITELNGLSVSISEAELLNSDFRTQHLSSQSLDLAEIC